MSEIMEENKQKKYRVVFTGGGTGGHIFPLLAIIRELKKLLPAEHLDIHYIGPKDSLSKECMEKEGVSIKYVLTGKIRNYKGIDATFQNFIDVVFRVPVGIIQSFFYLYFLTPDFIFSKGGHGSFPVTLTGKLFQIPIFFHESDAVLGRIGRFFKNFFSEVFSSFPKTEGVSSEKMLVVGNPVRKEVIGEGREEGREALGIGKENQVLLVLGGSQGSERINELLLGSLAGLLQDFEIIHQCGQSNFKAVKNEVDAVITDEDLKGRYHLYPFLDEKKLRSAYASADLIISRAGSGSIFEIAVNGRASIFIPLPEATRNHQVKNAYQYASFRASVVLEEDNITAHFFQGKVKELFSPIDQIKNMEKNARSFSRPRAGEIIASYLKEYLTQ